MKDLTQYKFESTVLIFNYLKDEDLDKLIKGLRKIERHAYNNITKSKDKSLWFKFFKGYTGAMYISYIETVLKDGTQANKEYLLECFRLTTSLDQEIEVYYS